MHDPRTSPALRTLADLTGDPPQGRWSWSIGRLDDAGRVSLGRAAASALGPGPLRLCWHHLALVVEPDPEAGAGRAATVDRRGRLLVPMWLRQRQSDVLVGFDVTGRRLVVAPVEVLDRCDEVLAGGGR